MRAFFGPWFRCAAVVVATSLVTPAVAWAAPTPDQMAEARRRYDRALELSDEGNYEDALIELQRAYELAPTYRLLYNLGVVSVAVHDYVKALDYFERYLQEGGSELDAARVQEVKSQMARLRPRIAHLEVTVNVPGASIALDDAPIGTSPLTGDLPINAGRHKVSATLPGYLPSETLIVVAGAETKNVSLSLLRGTAPPPEKPSKPIPWVGWGITAGLGAATAVTGVLALSAASKYDDAVNQLGVSSSDVASDYRTMRALSVTTDILLVATVVAGGVSLYFTLKPAKQPKKQQGLSVRPNGFVF